MGMWRKLRCLSADKSSCTCLGIRIGGDTCPNSSRSPAGPFDLVDSLTALVGVSPLILGLPTLLFLA